MGDAPDHRAAGLPRYTFAFQPIVDAVSRRVVSHEALVRGPAGEPAPGILQAIPASEIYRFDEESRVAALELAARLRFEGQLNLNLMSGGLQASGTAVESILAAARRCRVGFERVVIEVTEGEIIADPAQFARAMNVYRGMGVRVAIDDFGSGYAGLSLLADFQPDAIKLDMQLVRGIERRGPRQAIARAVIQVCFDLGMDVIAEGVETEDEYRWLVDEGVRLFQGYLFARPGFECLPQPSFPPSVP